MTVQNNLEIKGNLSVHPFAELLLETSEAKLTGSFRLSAESNKVIVYLNNGEVVFAVSNARRHRLFEILLREKILSQNLLAEIPNFANDLELTSALKSRNIISESEINNIFSGQIEEILKSVFDWSAGEWFFTPQTRIKEGIRFELKTRMMLIEYARNLPEEKIAERLKNPYETFSTKFSESENLELNPTEWFILSRFEDSSLRVQDINLLSSLPDSVILKSLYVLWLGGFLFRPNWQPAFSKRQVAEILSAKFSLKKESAEPAKPFVEEKPNVPPVVQPETPVEKPEEKPEQEEISLEAYLEQSENANDHYEVLNVVRDADLKEIKTHYFSYAKRFHPDMFHQEKDSKLLQRVQAAFAKTARAYETLKDSEARKIYDYKLGKNPVVQKPQTSDKSPKSLSEQQIEIAKESFEAGFSLLVENEYGEAVTFLARAAQLAPNNAKYRAYYGKALSGDEKQRYKADTELQAAIRLDPQNETYRLISAEFYIQYGLYKRAEGELKRLLEISPNHSEALNLIAKLPTK